MLGFYNAMQMINPNHRNIAMTVLSGNAFGEKALLSDHNIVWASKENGYFAAYRDELEKIVLKQI